MNKTNMNPDSKKIAALLSMASKKLGTSPQELKNQLESGDLSKILKNLPKDQAQVIKNAAGDKNAAQKILSSQQAQEIYNKLKK